MSSGVAVAAWMKKIAEDERRQDAVRVTRPQPLRDEFAGDPTRDMVIDCSAPDGGFVVRNSAPAAVSLTVTPSLDPASMACHYWFTPSNALSSREDRIHVIVSDGGSETLQSAPIVVFERGH
jgi:hypothetical protein